MSRAFAAAQAPTAAAEARILQRKCACGKTTEAEGQCEECKKKDSVLQRRSAGGGSPAAAPAIVNHVLRSPGRPLDSNTRSFMDTRFGHNFADVRVHTDAQAAESARSVGALAYTVGSDVVFDAGQYAPERHSGQRLLAHELAHVVQQRATEAPGVQTKLEVGPEGDRFEREAEAAADRAMSAAQPVSVPNRTAPRLQRATAAATLEPAESPAFTSVNVGEPRPLIIDDDATESGDGQMKKSEFLDQLRAAACDAADSELKAMGRSTEGCPYIARWIGRYRDSDSKHLERAVRKYAPESSGVTAAADYIPLVTARIRRGVSRWAANGDLSDVPEELKNEISGGGILGALGGALSAIGSAIGGLFTKAREGGVRAADPAAVQSQLHAGAPLDPGVRTPMERTLRRDFSRVRVHTDGRAAQLSSALNARAFTVGDDVAFGAGEYEPGTLAGDALIAHELAHVAQQQTGAAGQSLSHPALEQDADTAAAVAVSSLWGVWAAPSGNTGPQLRSGLSLQRCGRARQGITCFPDEADKIKAAKKRAVPMVNAAVARLDDFLKEPEKHKAVGDAIQCYFTGAAKDDIVSMRDVLNKVAVDIPAALESCYSGSAPFQYHYPPDPRNVQTVEPDIDYAITPVWKDTGSGKKIPDPGTIYTGFFDESADDRVWTVIHESTHRMGNFLDPDKDILNPGCRKLKLPQSIINPDSYVGLVFRLAKLPGEAGGNAITPGAGAPAVQRASRDATPIKVPPPTTTEAGTATGPRIVEDDIRELAPTQMRKSEFLDALRSAVCSAADAELAAVGRNTKGCPYIEKWIGRFREKDSSYVERALVKYAPESAGAAKAGDMIPLVAERVRRGVAVWANTGQITGVPEELAGELTGGGLMGAIEGVVAGIGSALSGIGSAIGQGISAIGSVFAKPREGAPAPAHQAGQVQSRLGAGRPLDAAVSSRMGPLLGHDFSQVRVHADSTAAQLSDNLNARAFTVGRDVAFAAGEYRPGTIGGDALIAHELAHVAQQREAAPSSRFENGAALERDADQSAAAAIGTLWGGREPDATPRLRSGLSLQRCGNNCPEAWKQKLDTTNATAQKWIASAVSQLSTFLAKPQEGDHRIVRRLKTHFHLETTGSGDSETIAPSALETVGEIKSVLEGARNELAKNPFVCNPEEVGPGGAPAYTPGWPFGLTRFISHINVYKPWFDEPIEEWQVATLIHEGIHFYGGKDDFARDIQVYFCDHNTYAALDTSDLLGLADSYSSFVYFVGGPATMNLCERPLKNI